MTYRVKDVLEILPAGKVRTSPQARGSISTNCDETRRITPMNQFSYTCIIGNCKKDILNQQLKMWTNFKKHQKNYHKNINNLKLDEMIIPVAWWEISADKLRYLQKNSLIKMIKLSSINK